MNKFKNRFIKNSLAFVFVIVTVFSITACKNDNTKNNSSSSDLSNLPVSSVLSEVQSNEINIVFSVIDTDGNKKEFNISSDKTNLKEILSDEGLIGGSDSEYGFFVTEVNGVTADDSKQEWWCLTKDGEIWTYGVSDTTVEDGDKFEFTLTVGY